MSLSKSALLLPVFALAACGTLNSGPKPLSFADTEGRVKTASFMKTVGGSGKIAGEVNIHGEYLLDIVRMNDDLSIAVRNDNGNSAAADLKSLADAKGFTLYAFSKYAGSLEVNRVTASRGICADYRGKGVSAAIADNMYAKQDGRVVFNSRGNIAAVAGKSKVESAALDFSAASGLSAAEKNRLEQDKAKMTAIHYARLEELIARGICS